MSSPEDDYLTDCEQAAGALLLAGVTALEAGDRRAVEAVAGGTVGMEASDLFMAGVLVLRDALRGAAHARNADTAAAVRSLGLFHARRPTRGDDGLD